MKLYRELAAVPLAMRLLVSGFVARLGQGVTVFAWIVLLGATLGSYGSAAFVAACLTAGTAVSAPVLGRLCDVRGARPVIACTMAAYCASQAALLWAAVTSRPLVVLCVIAVASGAVTPPFSAAVRTAWTRLTTPEPVAHLRHTAMSAESALFEIIFVLGPLIFSGCVLVVEATGIITAPSPAAAGPAVALALSIVLTACGGTWLVRSGILESRPGRVQLRGFVAGVGPLASPRFVVLLVVMAGVAFTFGATPVALAAHSSRIADGAATTGVWIAVWSLGSAVGGLTYGSRAFSMALPLQLVLLLVGLAAGYAAWTTTTGAAFLLALAVSGVVIAPAMAAVANLVAEYTPAGQRTEAYTWLGTTTLVFTSIGSAAAGALISDASGFASTMFACVAVSLVAAAGALTLTRRATSHVLPT